MSEHQKKGTGKPQLDGFEQKFWTKSLADLQAARTNLVQAQRRMAETEAALSGFGKYIQTKYEIPNATEISTEGVIQWPDHEPETDPVS